jgi:uncharacterized protein GlcG (DUF336 family)
MSLTLQDAKDLIAAAHAHGEQFGKALTIAIVDAGGHLILLERGDGARPMTPSIATSKAYSAAIMQRPSRMLKTWAEKEPAFFAQISQMGLHPIVPADGGVTIKRDGELIGGLGVSGGRPEEDQEICEKALEQRGYELDFDAWAGRR